MNACLAVRVNETDTFADEEGLNDEYFDFEDISGMALCSTSFYGCDILLFSIAVSSCRDLNKLFMAGARFWILKQPALCPKKHLQYACMCTLAFVVLQELNCSYCGVSILTAARVKISKHMPHGPAITT